MHKYKQAKHNLNSILLLLVFFVFAIQVHGQTSSPLLQGKWIKLAVTQSGFYQINAAWLAKHNIENSGPDKITIYTAHSGMLNPLDSYQTGMLKEIPAYYQSGTNKTWSVLFWGDSPHSIRQKATWEQETNLYSDSTFYFVQIDAPKTNPIKEIENSLVGTPNLPYAWALKHYEPETYNLLQSGQTWLGDAFYGNSTKVIQYTLADYLAGQDANLKIKFYSASVSPSTFSIPILGKSIAMSPILGGRYDQKATSEELNSWVKPVLSNNSWNWPINFQSTGGTGYLDYISLLYPKSFDGNHENPLYLLPNTSDSLLQIQIANLRPSQQIWINNGGSTWQKLAKNTGFSYLFRPNSRLAIANLEKANEPNFCGFVNNQNAFDLPVDTELVILSSPILETAARSLASYKTIKRKIAAKHITTQAIYHDFSGGKQDVTALRNFIRYQFQKPGSKLKYVILLGDASVDYKGQNAVSTALEKSCFVPTYQSEESFHPLLSYASDDYFGIDAVSTWKEGDPINVVIGRIPAKSPQEATMFINKLVDFESKQLASTPRFAWVADDGDSNIHMQDAEDFSNTLQKALIPGLQSKVYLDQYPMQSLNGSYTSPTATQAVIKLFEENADFIHFMGHGSESGWTDEKILTTNELVKLKNSNHLPILLTATCQFGRFDDPNILSGGEVSLLSDQGGAIALISTTRPVFQSSNYLFGQAFYQGMIANKENARYRLGDLFRDAKNTSQTGTINRNIQLIGDPTLALPWTTQGLQMTLDTARQEISLTGLMAKGTNLQVALYRMSDAQKTLGTKNTAFQYTQMSPILWKSAGISTSTSLNISVKNMPSLSPGQKYQLHAWTVGSTIKQAAAIELGPWQHKQTAENIAPFMRLEFPDEDVKATSPNPKLKISVADSSGLVWQNTMGKIAYLVLDDSVRIELASHFIPSLSNPNRGEINIQLKSLAPGLHKIQAFCWDIYNNYTEASLSFQVKQSGVESLSGYIYPNPLGPTFHFVFDQEKPWNLMPYEIQIYDLLGRLIITKKGISSYHEENKGKIVFDWQADEYRQFNSPMIIQIQLSDTLTNEIKTFRIKTSTLK
jgi:hypothetical protein